MLFQQERNVRDFAIFYHCWRSTGDNTEMLKSLRENFNYVTFWLLRTAASQFHYGF